MKLYVERCGSGWGGIYGQYLVDLDSNTYTVLNDSSHFNVGDISGSENIKWLLSLNGIICDKKLPNDCSLLRLLDGADIQSTGVSMDAQEDRVILINEGKLSIVYAPFAWPYITVSNPALEGYISKLIEWLSQNTFDERSARLPELKVPKSSETNNSVFKLGELKSDTDFIEKLMKSATLGTMFTHHASEESINELIAKLRKDCTKTEYPCHRKDNTNDPAGNL